MSTAEQILMDKGPDVLVISPKASVLDAAILMKQSNVGGLIIKEDAEILGILTERDLLRRVVAAKKDPANTLVEEVMTKDIVSCRLDDKTVDLQKIMSKLHIRHVPVVEDGALIGIISLRDVLAKRISEFSDEKK